MIWKIDNDHLPGHLPYIRSAPEQLFVNANSREIFDDLMERPRVAIVGTRRISAYGQQVTTQLASELAAHGVVIISGLALGIDGAAHRAALDVGGLTIAVLPSPVEDVYPRSHQALAKHIIKNNGAIVSEYPAGTVGNAVNFVARNRIVSGLAKNLLITEAAENSGTMHTARFALEQGIDVLAVPGNITSPTSAGANNLLKRGAIPITCTRDVLHALGLSEVASGKVARSVGKNEDEQALLDLMERGVTDGGELLQRSELEVDTYNQTMTMLEITARIRALGANQWGLA